jgi:peptidoglycan biosynthesis protein MviN/MurJ (putative lipid II flippase)
MSAPAAAPDPVATQTARPLVSGRSNAARASAAVAVGSLLTALLGGALSILVAIIVGEGAKTDGFFAAYSIYLFFVLFGSTMRVSLVPLLGSPADERTWRAVAIDAIARLGGLAAAVAVFVVIASPLLSRALTPGLHADARATTALTLAILAVASFCQVYAAILAATLAAARRFFATTALFVASMLLTVMLGGGLMLAFGILGASVGVLGGSIALVLGHLAYLGRFRFVARPRLRLLRDPGTWRLAAAASAGAAVAVAQQGQVSVALAFVSDQVGAVTAYTYGYFLATLLASVTVYVVALVMLPDVLAAVHQHGQGVVGDFLRLAVPMALYLYVPLGAAYVLFGRPVVAAVFGGSLSASSLSLLWDVSRIFVTLNLAFAVLAPLGSIVLALNRRRALVLPAVALVPVHIVVMVIVSPHGPVAVALGHAAVGATLPVAIALLAFGRAGLAMIVTAVWASAPVALIGLVLPAVALVAGAPATVPAAVALSAVALVLYAVLGTFAWPNVGGRATRMLLSRA